MTELKGYKVCHVSGGRIRSVCWGARFCNDKKNPVRYKIGQPTKHRRGAPPLMVFKEEADAKYFIEINRGYPKWYIFPCTYKPTKKVIKFPPWYIKHTERDGKRLTDHASSVTLLRRKYKRANTYEA